MITRPKAPKAPGRTVGKRAAMIAALAAAITMPAALPHTGLVEESVMVAERPAMSLLRTYQQPIFQDMTTKVMVIACSRQIGKSHTVAQWAGRRLLEKLKTKDEHLIVIISNSKANGIEIGQKVAATMRVAMEADARLRGDIECETPDGVDTDRDPELGRQSGVPDLELSDFSQRIEIRMGNKRGRVLVLSASPRTARGFSADLVLDEFAFHENAAAIWDAAYPMLDSNPEFVCRICSTHNGIGSLFNTWIKGRVFPTYSVTRSEAWAMGRGDAEAMEAFYQKWRALGPRNAAQADRWYALHGPAAQPQDRLRIMSMRTQDEHGDPRELTPAEAEAEATDKASYRQNYENDPADAGGSLLTWDVITRAERGGQWTVDSQQWSEATLARLSRMQAAEPGAKFWIGQDFARTSDLSVVSVLSDLSGEDTLVAMLEMRDRKSTVQRTEMERLLTVIGRQTGRVTMDSTGNGLGLAEMLEERYGSLILLINFSETVALDAALQADGRRTKTMGIPERMAMDLAASFEDGKMVIPAGNEALRDDLRKPCRVYRAGRVSMAAARTAADHADRFWSIALAKHGQMDGRFDGWTADDLSGVEVGPCPISTMRQWASPALSAFLFSAALAGAFVSFASDAKNRGGCGGHTILAGDPPLNCTLGPLNRLFRPGTGPATS